MFMGYLCVQIMCVSGSIRVSYAFSLVLFISVPLLVLSYSGFLSVFYLFFLSFSLFFGTVPVFYLERVRKGVYLGVCEYRENMEVVGEVENVIRRNYEKYIFNKSMQL